MNSPEKIIQNSVRLMLDSHPDKILWLLTKKESLKENSSRPVGCWLIGQIEPEAIKVGHYLVMSRLANQDNPNGKWGLFHSTEIQEIQNTLEGFKIRTKNSVYELKQLNSVMDVMNNKFRKVGFDPYKDSE